MTTEATVHNLQDLWDAERGLCTCDAVRWVELTEALVDTGATTLCLPIGLIRQLGLNKSYEKLAISSRGMGRSTSFRPSN